MQVGEQFPDFQALSHEGESVSLAGYREDKNLVVFFYPKATTRGCVRETIEFSERRGEFDALNTKIVGISVDGVALQKEHAIQCAAEFPLLSDEDKSLSTGLGILSERGTAMRTTYLLDAGGKVREMFEGVAVDGHVDHVLEAVKRL